MIYSLDLYQALLLVGLLLVAAGGVVLARTSATQGWLTRLPRSQTAGFVLLTIAAIWSWFLISKIDLGEFSHWRTRILILIPIAYGLSLKYVSEFLAARALGMVVLLAAEPLLESAWMRPEVSRLLLVSLTYVGILLGLFWIGMPYTLRDQLQWLTRSLGRLRLGGGLLLCYGVALLILGLTLRR